MRHGFSINMAEFQEADCAPASGDAVARPGRDRAVRAALLTTIDAERWRSGVGVRSTRGALPVFRPVGFPESPPEPGVPVVPAPGYPQVPLRLP